VEDLDRARQFYESAFGWKKSVDVPVYAEYELPNGQRIGLYARKSFALNTESEPQLFSGKGTTASELYFYCENLEADIERIKSAGAMELSGLKKRDWGDEAAYFRDPDGNVIVRARPV
jgi:predicted enzyme related to lactoylglutathione lyase